MPEPVHEPEPTPAEDKAWLAVHPKTRAVLVVARQLGINALIIGALTVYLNYRIEHEKAHADAGYGVVASRVEKTPTLEQFNTVVDRLNDLTNFVLANAVKPQPTAPSATIEANLAVQTYKKNLALKVQESQSAPLPAPQHLPSKLDDVPTKK